MTVGVGQLVARTYVPHPEGKGDGFVDIIKGALFRITAVHEGSIEAECIASAGYPPVGDTGWGFPLSYLTEPYFILGTVPGGET